MRKKGQLAELDLIIAITLLIAGLLQIGRASCRERV